VFIIAVGVLAIFDLSLLYFAIAGALWYILVRKWLFRGISVILISIYLINSFALLQPLDSLILMKMLVVLNTISNLIETEIMVVGCIAIGVVLGLYCGIKAKRVPPQYSLKKRGVPYFGYIVLLFIGSSLIIDSLVLGLVTLGNLSMILYYLSGYFVIYSLELSGWFLLIYKIDFYFHTELTQRTTRIPMGE
jgi:hypothetical protein